MKPRWITGLAAGVVGLGMWLGSASPAQAQSPNQGLDRFYYYPYTYFPHNYWPTQGPRWPEPVWHPYMRPPAYMAYPPFKEPNWHYHLWEPHHHYRGFHFWLDAF